MLRRLPLSLKIASLLAAAVSIPAITGASAATLEEQRSAFRGVYPSAELGLWEPVEEREAVLRDYVLWPDLRAAYLRTKLSDADAVRDFLTEYGDLRPGKEIRYRYTRRLARHDQFDEFLDIYDEYYADAGDPVLACEAANARIRTGQRDTGMALGRRLWLTGRSQVKECDVVFAVMRNAGELTESLLRQRYALAIGTQDFLLARYVARSIGETELAEANRWLRAQGDPATFLQQADISRSDPVYLEQLAYATRRLAVSAPDKAWREWSRLREDLPFDDAADTSVARVIALWSVRRRIDGADDLFARLPPGAVDDEVRHWVIRNALRDGRWDSVARVVDGLGEQERNREEWRYWKAVALESLGREAEAMLILGSLAREASYYGFLAADALGIDYAIETREIAADDAIIDRLSTDPALVRARELYLTGLDGRARSEWDDATAALDENAKVQAVLLAERWNWPSRAIAMAAKTGRYDSLGVRYPLPHRDKFVASAEVAGIPASWAYGVARSESIFMRDIRSSAGAIGLMQLMPATGRSTAKEIRLPYNGLATLTDPESNIRLGSTYLAKMHDRFGRHPAVATAAYNAGPRRVSQWLPDTGSVDARIWVETIPFNETRSYVRRVLTADIIFEWRLTGDVRRLSERLPAIFPERLLQTASIQ